MHDGRAGGCNNLMDRGRGGAGILKATAHIARENYLRGERNRRRSGEAEPTRSSRFSMRFRQHRGAERDKEREREGRGLRPRKTMRPRLRRWNMADNIPETASPKPMQTRDTRPRVSET